MAKHIHRAIAKRSTDRSWDYCVTPALCAADVHRQEAHGNITRHDVCACGATRKTEINGGRRNYGAWEVAK